MGEQKRRQDNFIKKGPWATVHVSRSVLGLLLLLGLAAPVGAQGDISFTATVNASSLSTDQTLTLQLALAGTFQSSGDPQFPAMSGFVVAGSSRSSQISIVNGAISSRVVFVYHLHPTETGELTIPPISIQVGKQTYQTQPITVQVSQGAPPAAQSTVQAQPGAAAPGELAGKSLYVEADVDNPRPVVGQQIIYRFRFYQAVQLFSQPRLGWPDMTGFLAYDLSPNNQYYQELGGTQYLVTEVRRALFPTAAGPAQIGPATLTIEGSFFEQGAQLATRVVDVDVQPLPAGAPAGFSGAVGSFEIAAQVTPTQTKVNEPVTLLVRISGAGNVNALSDPTQDVQAQLPGWRVYDPQIKTDVSQEGVALHGEKRFERPLVPKTDGELTLPPFRLVFFDPAAGEYRQVETQALLVHVAPGEAAAPGPVILGGGQQDLVVLASDIRHIKPAPPALTGERRGLLSQPLYWLGWVAPFLAVVGTWAWDNRRRHLAGNVAYARALRARRLAAKRLAEARRLAKGDEDTAYTAVARALTEYLGDKLNLPAAGLTRDLIQRQLAERSVPSETSERLLACLDWADSGRFAPTAAGRGAMALVEEAELAIKQIEEVSR